MRMGRGQVRTLLASNTSKVFFRIGEGPRRTATDDARGVAGDEARSHKATEGICRKVNFLIETRLLPARLPFPLRLHLLCRASLHSILTSYFVDAIHSKDRGRKFSSCFALAFDAPRI